MLILAGPTTCGKTAVTTELASRLEGEVITSDEMFFYSFFKLGTGRDDYTRRGLDEPHLSGILHPTDPVLEPTEFARRVDLLLPDLLERGRMPIVEGCTVANNAALMQYFGAPTGDADSPVTVVALRWGPGLPLQERIEARLQRAVDAGLIEEAQAVLERGYEDTYVVHNGLVYPPLFSYLQGEISLRAALSKIVVDAMHMSECQLEKYEQLPQLLWIERFSEDPEEVIATIEGLPAVRKRLDQLEDRS